MTVPLVPFSASYRDRAALFSNNRRSYLHLPISTRAQGHTAFLRLPRWKTSPDSHAQKAGLQPKPEQATSLWRRLEYCTIQPMFPNSLKAPLKQLSIFQNHCVKRPPRSWGARDIRPTHSHRFRMGKVETRSVFSIFFGSSYSRIMLSKIA